MSDAEDWARRNPALFLGGAFALGLLASRFLKSGMGRQSQSSWLMAVGQSGQSRHASPTTIAIASRAQDALS